MVTGCSRNWTPQIFTIATLQMNYLSEVLMSLASLGTYSGFNDFRHIFNVCASRMKIPIDNHMAFSENKRYAQSQSIALLFVNSYSHWNSQSGGYIPFSELILKVADRSRGWPRLRLELNLSPGIGLNLTWIGMNSPTKMWYNGD